MSKNLWFIAFVMVSSFILFWGNDRAESLDLSAIKSGGAIQISPHAIIIVDDSDNKQVQFAVDSNTVYNGVQELKDIKAGDKLQVNYKINHNKKTAISITKVEANNEDTVDL